MIQLFIVSLLITLMRLLLQQQVFFMFIQQMMVITLCIDLFVNNLVYLLQLKNLVVMVLAEAVLAAQDIYIEFIFIEKVITILLLIFIQIAVIHSRETME